MAVASVAVGAVYLLAGVDLCVYGGGILLLLLSEILCWKRVYGHSCVAGMKGVLLSAADLRINMLISSRYKLWDALTG